MPTSPLDDYWFASSISGWTAGEFAARVRGYQPVEEGPHPFVGPGAPVPLAPVRDRFQRLLAARRSDRRFDRRPLTHQDVERLLASVGPSSDGRRTVPEAGGLDAVHVYLLAQRVAGPLGGRIVRYDHRHHVVADVGPMAPVDEVRRLFLLDEDHDDPAAVVVFVLDDAALRRKYGERAGRFGWQQVGHAAQNVSLRLAADGLAGYVLGGGLDVEVLAALGLGHTRARYGGAVACGR